VKTPRYEIQYQYGQELFIKPFFDVHWGATACDEKAFLQDLKETDENTYLLFGGDLFDSILPSDRRYRKSTDKTITEAIIDECLDEMVEVLKPYRHRILGIGLGNHEDVLISRCGTNVIKRLCDLLDVQSIGYSGLYRLSLRKGKHGGGGRKIIIRYHHGWGGGSRTQGADLTKYSKDVAYWEADLFLYGHVHKNQVDKIPRLGLVGDKLVAKPKIICICGSYLKTYMKGDIPTYSEKQGYPPIMIESPCIKIKPTRTYLEIKAYTD